MNPGLRHVCGGSVLRLTDALVVTYGGLRCLVTLDRLLWLLHLVDYDVW